MFDGLREVIVSGYMAAGILAFADPILPTKLKKPLSNFIFGYSYPNISNLGKILSKALVDFFFPNEKISFRRISGYSSFALIITSALIPLPRFILESWNGNFKIWHLYEYLNIIRIGLTFCVIAFPASYALDIISLKISKRLLSETSKEGFAFFINFTFDTVISWTIALLPFLIATSLYFNFNTQNLPISIFIIVGLSIFISASAIFLNLLIFIILLSAIFAKILLLSTRLNQTLGAYTSLPDHPMLFVGLIYLILSALLHIISIIF